MNRPATYYRHRFRGDILLHLGTTRPGHIRAAVIGHRSTTGGTLPPLPLGHTSSEYLLANLDRLTPSQAANTLNTLTPLPAS